MPEATKFATVSQRGHLLKKPNEGTDEQLTPQDELLMHYHYFLYEWSYICKFIHHINKLFVTR